MLYFSSACEAQSTASCCMSSDISAFFITAFLSDMIRENGWFPWTKCDLQSDEGYERPPAVTDGLQEAVMTVFERCLNHGSKRRFLPV
jgi:hypothetical protein